MTNDGHREVMSQAETVVKILGVENILNKPSMQAEHPQILATIVRGGLPASSAIADR